MLASGSFSDALFHPQSPLSSILHDLQAEINGKNLDAHSIVIKLRDRVEDFLTTGPSTSEKHLSLVFGAVAAFMIFVQANWTGPALPESLSLSPVRPFAIQFPSHLCSFSSTTPTYFFWNMLSKSDSERVPAIIFFLLTSIR